MKFRGLFTSCIIFTLLLSCSSGNDTPNDKEEIPIPDAPVTFYYGADLSYVNEMEDCGTSYKDANSAVDKYGYLLTIKSIIDSRVNGSLRIKLRIKQGISNT